MTLRTVDLSDPHLPLTEAEMNDWTDWCGRHRLNAYDVIVRVPGAHITVDDENHTVTALVFAKDANGEVYIDRATGTAAVVERTVELRRRPDPFPLRRRRQPLSA